MNEEEQPLPVDHVRFSTSLDEVAKTYGKPVQEVAHMVSLHLADPLESIELEDGGTMNTLALDFTEENLRILEDLGLITVHWGDGY
ncbi:hypothetical protein DYU11_25255 [Fibrisoma montanum]|uniref:Uncharacterized protein n=1 Tax=Fibrisoma montanum TaxID=2305895 RepID=A0A418M1C7_9BACT|nr:hypothetical protein [Fibrisoma montanum]RIV19412.1 hypothetical protein DYU11_25255 [Fibrisoma montanum]